MAECRLVHEIAWAGTLGQGCHAICICYTHGMKIEGGVTCSSRCPVGQIEDAVDRGIEKIKETLENKG